MNNKFHIGDLIEANPPGTLQQINLGVVMGIGDKGSIPIIKVCWADNYGTFWCEPSKLKLIAKGKQNV